MTGTWRTPPQQNERNDENAISKLILKIIASKEV
jgi:hypothetical protein